MCSECGAETRIIHGAPEKFPHKPHCSRGRCGATLFPNGGRCVKVGVIDHGEKHEDTHGNIWDGLFTTLDQALEDRDS